MSLNLMHIVDDRWVSVMSSRAVQISAPGEGLLRMDAVEVGPQFSKPRTNALLRCMPGQPDWQFFVDDDLRYLGEEPLVRRLFRGQRFQHWLALVPPRPVRGDVHAAVWRLLEWLHSPMQQALPHPERPADEEDELDPDLEGVARLCGPDELADDGFQPTAGQADLIDQVAAAVTQPRAACCPVLHGPSGGGKHVLVRAAAAGLLSRGLADRVLEVSGVALAAGMLFRPQKDERLQRVLQAAATLPRTLVLLDQIDAAVEQSDIAAGLLAQHLEQGLRMAAVSRGEFALHDGDEMLNLRRRLRMIWVAGTDAHETAEILRRRLAGHPLVSRVALAGGMTTAIVQAAGRCPGAAPGAALDLLDALLARAAWSGADVIGPDDLLHFLPQDS